MATEPRLDLLSLVDRWVKANNGQTTLKAQQGVTKFAVAYRSALGSQGEGAPDTAFEAGNDALPLEATSTRASRGATVRLDSGGRTIVTLPDGREVTLDQLTRIYATTGGPVLNPLILPTKPQQAGPLEPVETRYLSGFTVDVYRDPETGEYWGVSRDTGGRIISAGRFANGFTPGALYGGFANAITTGAAYGVNDPLQAIREAQRAIRAAESGLSRV